MQLPYVLQSIVLCLTLRSDLSATGPESHFFVAAGTILQKRPYEYNEPRHFETLLKGGNHAVRPILVAV